MTGLGEGPAWREAKIAAVAPGFGAAWIDAGMIAEKGEATLRLVRDDVPIRGLVRDAQGRPVAGAAITVFRISAPKEGWDLDAMLASGEYEGYRSDPGFPGPTWLGRQGTWTTDAGGRFEINGVGRDRMAGLEITSPEMEKVVLFAMAREAKTSPKPRSRPSMPPGLPMELVQPPAPRLVGSTFEASAGPTKPLFGVVRKKGKGTPIGAVSVFGFEPASRDPGQRHDRRPWPLSPGRAAQSGMVHARIRATRRRSLPRRQGRGRRHRGARPHRGEHRTAPGCARHRPTGRRGNGETHPGHVCDVQQIAGQSDRGSRRVGTDLRARQDLPHDRPAWQRSISRERAVA